MVPWVTDACMHVWITPYFLQESNPAFLAIYYFLSHFICHCRQNAFHHVYLFLIYIFLPCLIYICFWLLSFVRLCTGFWNGEVGCSYLGFSYKRLFLRSLLCGVLYDIIVGAGGINWNAYFSWEIPPFKRESWTMRKPLHYFKLYAALQSGKMWHASFSNTEHPAEIKGNPLGGWMSGIKVMQSSAQINILELKAHTFK